jgi:hypothetical protein
MWKLIKAELDYIKPVLIGIYVLFISIFVLRFFLVDTPPRSILNYGITWILSANLIMVFSMVVIEVAENRLMNQVQLPIPSSRIGNARILFPLILLSIFIVLLVIELILLPDVYRDQLISFLNSRENSSYLVVYLLLFWITAIYGIRLFSEMYGRFLLGILGVYFIIRYGSQLNFFGLRWSLRSLTRNLFDFEHIDFSYGIWILLIFLLVFTGVIYFSYNRRNNFIN